MESESQVRPYCRYCGSSDIVTPAKSSASSYLRCKRCDQVWHPDRIVDRDQIRRQAFSSPRDLVGV